MKEPIYKKIENYLKELIDTKQLKEGELLPSENQLCERFNVTRMTVRSALNNLVKEGYIIKKKGIGSVVLASKVHDNISVVAGFTKEMKEKGFDVATHVEEFEIIEADKNLAEHLKINEGDKVWKICRVRIANNEKLSYMLTFMPMRLFPNLKKIHCEGSLYQYIEGECGYKIALAERSVEAVTANKEIKKVLDLKHSASLLHIEQISKLESSDVFEYSHTYHYRYKLTLSAVSK